MHMPAANQRKKVARKRDVTLNMRLPEETRGLIDSAAAMLGKTRTEFVVESAKDHALDVLLDQRLFALDAKNHAAFVSALDNPPAANDRLKALLTQKAPWE